MKKGDIIWANDQEKHPHPIVYLEPIDKARFFGCILSSHPTNGNMLMKTSHFCQDDKYRFRFNKTHLVISDSFIKLEYWVDGQDVVGCLTNEGIAFVEENLIRNDIFCQAPIWEIRPR